MIGIKKMQDWMDLNAVDPEDATDTIGQISLERYGAISFDEKSLNASTRSKLANEAKAALKARPNPNPNHNHNP